MAIELRTNKASALTYNEMDRNFSSFFYSASVDNGNILKLWYTGSTTLNTSGEDFGPARFIPIDLQPTTGAVPTLTVAGDPRTIQFRHSTNPVLDADNGFLYNTALQLGIGASIPAANAKIHARGTNTVPATLRLESTTNNGTNRRATVDFYQGTVLYGTIGRHDPFENNMYIKSWTPSGKFAESTDPGHIRFVVGNNVTIGAFTSLGFGIGTFQPQHTFHAEGNGYFAGNIGIGAYPGAAKVTVYQIDQLQSSAGDFKHLVSLSNVPISSVNALHTSIVRTSAGADWTTSGMRIQQQVDSEYMGYLQFSGDNNNYGITMGTGTSGPGGSILAPIEAFRITQPSQTAAGKVGINTKTPNAQLDVNGDTIVTGSFTVKGNTLTTGNADIQGTATIGLSLTTGTTVTVGTNLIVGATASIGYVGASVESAPRILTVSQTAGSVGRVEYITNIVPKGAIMMWGGLAQNSTTPPPGWRLCDGDNSGNTNGVTIPDLRERFIVGAGGNSPGVVTKNYTTATFQYQSDTWNGATAAAYPNSTADGEYTVVGTGPYYQGLISGNGVVFAGPVGGVGGVPHFVYEKTSINNKHYFIHSVTENNYILVTGAFTPIPATITNYGLATNNTYTPGKYFRLPASLKKAVADYARDVNGVWTYGKRPDFPGFYYYDTLGYNVGDRGGFNEVKLEVAQMPSHNHTLNGQNGGGANVGGAAPFPSVPSVIVGTSTVGGNLPHENRPPYYALAFIIYTGV